jgi:DNA-binding transcriptional LysR family regulator
MAQYLLLPSLVGLSERHPRLHVELEVSDRLADLARDGIDIAIRTIALPDTMVARRVGTLGRALYAAPSYLERAGAPADPEALRGHRLIVNSAAPQLNHWPFIVDGKPFELVAEGFWRTNDTGLAANMVLEGLGIGRLATVAAEPLVRAGRLVPVLPGVVDVQFVPVYAVVASTRQRLPKISACIDYWAEWIGGGCSAASAESEYPCASSGRSRDASRSATRLTLAMTPRQRSRICRAASSSRSRSAAASPWPPARRAR